MSGAHYLGHLTLQSPEPSDFSIWTLLFFIKKDLRRAKQSTEPPLKLTVTSSNAVKSGPGCGKSSPRPGDQESYGGIDFSTARNSESYGQITPENGLLFEELLRLNRAMSDCTH